MLPALGCQAQSVQSEKHYQNGTALVIDGEYEEAIAELNKTIELDPKYADAYYNRDLACDKSGEVAQAITDHEKCIELSNDSELVRAVQMRLDALTK